MDQSLQTALTLLLIGMVSVFLILGLVVLAGRGLIYFVNRYLSKPAPELAPLGMPEGLYPKAGISKEKLVAITAAVEIVTQGQGRITHLERV